MQKKHMEQEVIEELIPLPQLLSRTYQKVDVHGQRAGRLYRTNRLVQLKCMFQKELQ